jgi:hypothetical protein
MYWTLELASHLEDAPWPATKDELIDYAIRSGAPVEVIENLQALEDDGEPYENIEEIWPAAFGRGVPTLQTRPRHDLRYGRITVRLRDRPGARP